MNTTRSFLGETGLVWMTVGMVCVREMEGIVVVDVFFKMERSRVVVTLSLSGYREALMKSLLDGSASNDAWCI